MQLSRLVTIGAFVVAALCTVGVSSAPTYTGGPVRLEMAGIEPTEAKVFYRVHRLDESGESPQVWFFDLNGPEPTRPIRARSLEVRKGGATSAWAQLSQRLRRLRGQSQYTLDLAVSADSVGVEPSWNAPRYKLSATVSLSDAIRRVELDAYCDPIVTIRGVYLIPGRSEEIVVLSVIGRAYGCEEVESPVLFRGRNE